MAERQFLLSIVDIPFSQSPVATQQLFHWLRNYYFLRTFRPLHLFGHIYYHHGTGLHPK